jgi:hypothetical protein
MFESPTVNLSALCNSCAKIACRSSELIFTRLYAGSSIQNACERFVSYIHLSSANVTLHPTPQTETWIFKQLYLGNQSEFDTFDRTSPHNDVFYHIQKCWPFLLNHSVCQVLVSVGTPNVTKEHFRGFLQLPNANGVRQLAKDVSIPHPFPINFLNRLSFDAV